MKDASEKMNPATEDDIIDVSMSVGNDVEQDKDVSRLNANKDISGSIVVLQQFARTLSASQMNMMKSLNVEGINAISAAMEQSTRRLKESILPLYTQMTQQDILLSGVRTALAEMQKKQSELIRGMDLAGALSESVLRIYENLQMPTIAYLKTAFQTPMITEMTRALANLEYTRCIPIADEALSGVQIAAADVAFFKNTELAGVMRKELTYPRGFATALDNLNKTAAAGISDNGDIYYKVDRRAFTSDRSMEESTITSQEMNTVCAAKTILDGMNDEFITEVELMVLISVLFRTPSFALNAIGGQKILRMVRSMMESDSELKHGFDRDIYFHSRARNAEDVPYAGDEMLRAPVGVTGPGRYNHLGRSHYYFADTKDGAEEEIRKHNAGKLIQTIRLTPIKSIVLLDLSGTMRRGATFLRFLRFPLKDVNDRMPREYLIPCFVAECCQQVGFDGIKYYGGKGYSNYVTWNDGYFDIAGNA